jgi:hypothetical protein
MKTPQVDALPGTSPLGIITQPTRLALTSVGQLEISTVDLGDFAINRLTYETCVFYPNGDSRVMERYSSQAEALTGHLKIANFEISKLIVK